MFTLVEIFAVGLLGFFLLYLFFLSVLALFVPVRLDVRGERKRKFAVVVPAHNESSNIAATIKSIRSLDYPSGMYDVVVIADNCSDHTASVARQNGAIAMERNDSARKGKGYALQWCFDMLLQSPAGYDGYVVIDADSVVSRNFLQVMDWYLGQGHRSVQSADLVAPNPGAWSSEVSRISLTLYNYVRPLGRKAIGCSAGLRGNGMCFSADLLRSIPWKVHSLTEDLEYGLVLLQHGILTTFAPEARVLATMPAKPKNAESQRARWEGGRIPVLKKFTPILFSALMKNGSWKYCDALIELLTPAFVNMVAIVIVITLIKLAGVEFFSFNPGIPVGMWTTLLLIAVLYVGTGLVAAKADRALYKAVVYFPLYVVWKIQLYLKLASKGLTKEWMRTVRE